LYYIKIWNDINKKSNFASWSQNIEACNVFELSDGAIKQLINKINADKSTIGLLAYASAFDAICRFLDANPSIKIKAKVNSAIAMSEGLNDYTKEAIQRHFNCVCISRYSNVENGMIAQQALSGGKEFYINFASYFVEVLNFDNNESCPFGKEGRIVITDLFNKAMPMIRYDTGDIGVMNEKIIEGKKIHLLEKIEGRKMDMVFNTSGDLVSSFTITNSMWKYTELIQYQFIQIQKDQYLFKLNCDVPFKREDELIKEFQEYFGPGAKINVEYVNEIPLLHSGKRKKVMNQYI
jgi:phenylacetate-CoA ligase